MLGKTFDSKDLETIAEDARDLDDAIDHIVREGILDEERESRGDRLTFSSGIVRDALYAGLSRRKRRSLHRRYAELVETRNAGRLERVYPELVHHFSQADVPEKTVEYALKLAQKSLDAFSADEVIRVAKIALDYLEDAEEAEDRRREADARVLLARGHRMAGGIDAALREAEAAVRVFEAGSEPARTLDAVQFAADTAWHARRVDEARRWVERGMEIARGSGDAEHLGKLLSLGATLANLRGEYATAAAYQSEIEKLAPDVKAAEEPIPQGGTLVVAIANPIAATEPGLYQTNEEHEALASVFERLVVADAQGSLAPSLAERWDLEEGGLTWRLHLRPGVVFSDGTPLTAAAVKASLERAIRLSRDQLPAAFLAIRGVPEFLAGGAAGVDGIDAPAEREVSIRLSDPLPIFPSLLTDPRTAIARAPADEAGEKDGLALGTGPFRMVRHTPDHVVLERNPRYAREPARVERIEFRAALAAPAIAAGLRDGSLDIARDLLPQDLEAILREPRWRAGLVETPKKNTYFALFHTESRAGSNAALRTALAGAVRMQDLVWGSLGRLALPATGLIPPGILGHDAGRRQAHVSRERAAEAIRGSGLPLPVRLRVAIHPILLNQFGALTQALFRAWEELGVEAEVVTTTMPEFLESWFRPRGSTSCSAAGSPTTTTPTTSPSPCFTPGTAPAAIYFCSPETDRILEEARGEPRPAASRGALSKVRARAPGSGDSGPPLSRSGLPDRRPSRARHAASLDRALRQLRRARQGRGRGRIGRAPTGGQAAAFSTSRSPASSGRSTRRSARRSNRARSCPVSSRR